MRNCPLISIITPVYNVERYLPQCIESVISQTFQDWELLLVDDGSTDNSGEICDAYALKDSRIRVFHKENTGQADSRNVALQSAQGQLIGFIDSDDWVDDDMYDTLYRTLVGHESDIAICGYYLDYKDGSCPVGNAGETLVYSGVEALHLILDDKVIKSFLWDKLFRREMITELLPKSYYYEDYSTLFKWFVNAGKVAFCQEPKYHYRQRKGSTDHDSDPRKRYHFFVAEQERYRYLQQHHLLPERAKEFADKVVLMGVQETKGIARHAADRAEALRYIRKIRQALQPYLPVSCKSLGFRKYVRLWKLQHSVAWYVFSMRLGALFMTGKKKKEERYYE